MENSSIAATIGLEGKPECKPVNPTWAGFLAIIPLLEVVLNSIIVIATYRSRHRLRHNYVYAYVISTLMGNVVFGLLSFYNILNYAFMLERMWGYNPEPFTVDRDNPDHMSLQRWWAFKRGFTSGMYLVNNANVSALIYGIRDSSYFVGRSASLHKKDDSQFQAIRRRRNKAAIAISLIWVIPLAVGLMGLWWNCLEHCICVYAEYGGKTDFCQSNIYRYCSRIWQPLMKSFLALIGFAWIVEVVGIMVMLITTVRKSIKVMKPRRHELQPSIVSQAASSNVSHDTKLSENAFLDKDTCPSESLPSPTKSKHLSTTANIRRKTKNFTPPGSINRTVKFLFMISIFFFVTGFPSVVVILVDVFNANYAFQSYLILGVIMVGMLYGLIQPIILICYMTRLRSAVQNLFLSIKCCTKTTVSRPSSGR